MYTFKQNVIAKYSLTAQKTDLDHFYAKNHIDPENMHYLGSGSFGEAYDIGNKKVLKKTTSRSEYKIAKEIQQEKPKAFAKIFDTAEINKEYYIVVEKLHIDSKIEDLFVRVVSMLETQQLPITYLGHFDEEEYIEKEGDEVSEDSKISQDVLDFMNELEDVIQAYRQLGIEAADIRSENLGRDHTGKLKAFDIDDRDNRSHWKWSYLTI